ncbi:phosphoadenylyl-sulfate reductase [Algicola sagamiensis]|uniref:phosphoadenylyl-sulfate reductase n=1 Tax=Algicola sagamiensis TaxID=163869 RepID=UPI00036FCE47|nr:phosphoadenylyl-sulfate reductase [Algicola sagamiensis]
MGDYHAILSFDATEQQQALLQINELFSPLSAQERIVWSLAHLPANPIVSSSFGIQAAVMLHLMTQTNQEIPVVLTDTGYLFPETYQFIESLTERLALNLHTYRAVQSPAWQEAVHGQRWLQGEAGIKAYNQQNKVEPMRRALSELEAQTWFSGLRRSQSSTRQDKPFVEISHGAIKVYPILDWDNRDVHYYLEDNDLPYHPLWDQGYVSVGDVHTTRKLEAGMSEEETRFFGLQRECGLHTDGDGI